MKDTSHAGFESLLSAISDIIGPEPQQEKGEQVAKIPESGLDQQLELQPEEKDISQPPSRESEPTVVKPSKPKSEATTATEPISPEPQETSLPLKLGVATGVIVLLIIGIWW